MIAIFTSQGTKAIKIRTFIKLNRVWKTANPSAAASGFSKGLPLPILIPMVSAAQTVAPGTINFKKYGRAKTIQVTPTILNIECILADRLACTLPTNEANSAVMVVPIFSPNIIAAPT